MIRSDGSTARCWLQPWIDKGLDLLYPTRCAGCGRPGELWCPACDAGITRLTGRLCPQCGLPGDVGPGGCASCRVMPPCLPIRLHARYRGPIIRALLQLKYRPNRPLASLMGGWLATLAGRESWHPGVIVPVPLGRKRLKQRGYNQASLIAAGLADCLGAQLGENLLARARETRSQVGLGMADRQRNVQGAFLASPFGLEGLSVCAGALLDAGVQQVMGLTVARA